MFNTVAYYLETQAIVSVYNKKSGLQMNDVHNEDHKRFSHDKKTNKQTTNTMVLANKVPIWISTI